MLLLPFSNLLNVKAETVTITTDDTKTLASDSNFKYVTNKAKLTISGDNQTDTFIAYKILDVYYNETTNEMSYDFTTDFKSFLTQLPEDDSFKNLDISGYQKLTSDSDHPNHSGTRTASTLNKLVSKYATYLKKVKNITGIDTFVVNESNKRESTAEVEIGSYLILPKKIVEKIVMSDGINALDLYTYGVSIANVVFTVENGSWDLLGTNVSPKTTYLDNFSILVNKNITSFDDIDAYNSDITYSASNDLYLLIGGDSNYDEAPTNTESSILSNTAIMSKIGNKELVFPKGITLDSIYDMSDADDGTVKEITIRDGKIYIMDGNEEKRYADITNDTINNKLVLSNVNFGVPVALLLKLKVDNNVSVGSTTNIDKLNDYGNKIITNVTYLKDAYVDITGMDQATAEAAVLGTGTFTNTIYTYGIKVTNKNNDGATLDDGVFNICTDKECNTTIGTTTIANDIIQFRGLNDTNTYYLKQTKAPTGYKLLTDVIELNPTNLNKEVGLYNVEVSNDKMGLLPSTGGLGTIFYTLIGLVVVGIGAYEVIKYSKKQVNN